MKNAREPSKIGRSGCIEGASFLHCLTLTYNPPEQLKIPRWQHRTGSSPVPGTNSKSRGLELFLCCFYEIFEGKLDGVIKIAIVNE